MENKMNLTMLTDFYELTMANGYFETGMADNIAYFDTVSYTHLDVYKRQVLNVSTKTIQRHIKDMENVKYVGSGYSGHWEITE